MSHVTFEYQFVCLSVRSFPITDVDRERTHAYLEPDVRRALPSKGFAFSIGLVYSANGLKIDDGGMDELRLFGQIWQNRRCHPYLQRLFVGRLSVKQT
jgi:hypothetical protein